MKRGQNIRTNIVVDTDDRAFARPDRDQEPDREFNRLPVERVPIATSNLYCIEERAGFRRAAVPDLPGMVQRYERAGYKCVTSASADKSDEHGRSTTQMGSVMRVNLNFRPDAPWHSAVVMEIPIEYWNEDLERELQEIDRKEETFNPGKFQQEGLGSSTYGEFKRTKKYIK